jgi:type 1 glutamine amidotransferase
LARGTAQAAPTDCPAAYTPYSSGTTLLDLLLDPRSRAVLDERGLLKALPPFLRATTPPTLAAIITPSGLADLEVLHLDPSVSSPAALEALDRKLAEIPITRAAAEGRCARYDHARPVLPRPDRRPAMLVFDKITGFRDPPAVNAARKAFATFAAKRGWFVTFTDNGAVFDREQLKNYDVVVWNNVSGDALTVPQEKAFKAYMLAGGGYVGVHGSGGDSVYLWDWYPDVLIGARFVDHTHTPWFASAKIVVEQPKSGITAHLPDSWTMTDEWYSFAESPRRKGAHVLARLDEASYNPGPRLAMGDHPIAWTRCIGNGRAFYSAIGHRPQSYTEPNSLELLEQGLVWAAGAGETRCQAGHETPARPGGGPAAGNGPQVSGNGK